MSIKASDESLRTAQQMRDGEPEQAPHEFADATAADILDAQDMTLEPVDVPVVNKRVYVKTMTALERDQFEGAWLEFRKSRQDQNGVAGFRAFLVAWSCTDKDGKLLFSPNQAVKLGNKSARILDAIVEKSMRLNGLSDNDVEQLAGNSETGQPDDSPTDSPSS